MWSGFAKDSAVIGKEGGQPKRPALQGGGCPTAWISSRLASSRTGLVAWQRCKTTRPAPSRATVHATLTPPQRIITTASRSTRIITPGAARLHRRHPGPRARTASPCLAFRDYEVIAGTLAEWFEILAGYVPEPFRALSGADLKTQQPNNLAYQNLIAFAND